MNETTTGQSGQSNDRDGAEIDTIAFEDAFRLLEDAVKRLESGDLSLDEALAVYEQGTALSARCANVLETAELRIRQVDGEGRDSGALDVSS